MKHIIDNYDYEIIVKNLEQAKSLVYLVGSNVNERDDKSNIFRLLQDLVNYALRLVEDSESLV